MIVGLGSTLVWYFLQKGSKIYSIKAQMKDETSQYKLHFFKTAISFNFGRLLQLEGERLLVKKLRHERLELYLQGQLEKYVFSLRRIKSFSLLVVLVLV